MSAEKWEAEIRYEALREAARARAYDRVKRQFPELAEFSVGPFDDFALDILLSTWSGEKLPWEKIRWWCHADTHRIEVAIWHQEAILCGVMAGGVSDGPDNVTIRFIERQPGYLPAKGFVGLIATETAHAYAILMGKQRVRAKEPSKGAIPLYKGLGFTLEDSGKSPIYYAKRVTP